MNRCAARSYRGASSTRPAAIEAYVWTPAEWLSGEVEEMLRTRRSVGALAEESADAAQS